MTILSPLISIKGNPYGKSLVFDRKCVPTNNFFNFENGIIIGKP